MHVIIEPVYIASIDVLIDQKYGRQSSLFYGSILSQYPKQINRVVLLPRVKMQ